ncbi:tetratricopeptide repeat protein [Paenibacillus piri]|uniref:Tetratricopeptide repeat protein n=1 Tax=Paenibacillus piri TaxID=2547395 RepID=A0A4R5KDY6_9BACL|nr:tetratricopeptide repeat protein [Paenibacillus piri]TDF93453.1 tetratricopeptide repeat protein [Paenibacillus piri]
MKENKWVLALIAIMLIAAGWYVYPSLFTDKQAVGTQAKSQEYEQALQLFKDGKPDQAKTLLEQGIASEPGEGKYHFALGNIARQQNKMDEALKQYEQAVQKSPRLVEAYNNLTAVLMIQNKMDDALKTAEAGLSQEPAFKDLLFKKGQLLYVKKEYGQAVSILQPLTSDKAYAEAYRFIGLSLVQEQKLEAAVQQFKLYLQQLPESAPGRTEIEKMTAELETHLKTSK